MCALEWQDTRRIHELVNYSAAMSQNISLLERARSLATTLPHARAQHEADRQLRPEVVAALREEGMLSCLVPVELGGAELDAPTYVRLLEVLAQGDPATAWCVMTASTSTLIAMYLPRTTTAELWRGRTSFLAGVFAPSGALTPEGPGWRLTGRWSYASGAHHADWFALGALLEGQHRVCLVPAADVQILDNWQTLGLRGTGSHDAEVRGVLVPPERVASIFTGAPWSEAPLYRVPVFGLLAVGVAACALGVARAALDASAARITGDPGSVALVRFAQARAQLDAARAYLLQAADDAQHAASAGAVSASTRGELRLAAWYVAQQCEASARAAFHLGGGASARSDSPVGAALRDLETLLTHRMVIDRVAPAAARAVLGLAGAPPDL